MQRAYIGIDPGLYGAAVLITESGAYRIWDWMGLSEASRMIHEWKSRFQVLAVLEQVHSTPNDGHVGAFRFGKNAGHWEGILAGALVDYVTVPPQRWIRAMVPKFLGRTPKERSLNTIKEMFPEAYKHIHLKRHHNRADAFLMAVYLKQIVQRLGYPAIKEKASGKKGSNQLRL